ncbi:MAG: Hsp20 family protein [Rhizobiaceae bacterium]|nr:Hsp20 family protein [Rhizobiaceae bacterium]
MTRITAFSSPLLLGFDEIERMLDRATKSTNDGYPPYNIERIQTASNGSAATDIIRITLAVAGFTQDDLDITIEENQLTIKGQQQDDEDREYLHHGIAARQFQKAFVLAEGIEIDNAELQNGLLEINLIRNEPERIIRKISITSKE